MSQPWTTRELDADVPSDWDSIELGDLRVSDDGERTAVSLSGEAGELELEATRVAGVTLEAGSPFADATGQIHEAFAVAGHRRAADAGRRRAAGSTSWAGSSAPPAAPDWARIELIRSLTGVLDDGSLLVMASARPRGAAGHGEEAASAVLLDSEGALTSFEEPLLSTEYDASGAHRRAGLELWAAEEDTAPLRGAGTLLGPSASDFGQLKTAFLRFTLDGAPGTASYDIDTRPPSSPRITPMPIRAVISDFGGVLTTPLLRSFVAFQDETGISFEALGKAMQRGRRAQRRAPAVRARAGADHRGRLPRAAARRARARARPPARAAPLQRDLLRGARPQRADDRADARPEAARLPDGAADQQRPRVGAAVALDAAGRRDLRAGRRLGLRRHAQARAARSTS